MADNDVTRIAGNIGAMNALYSLQNINKQLSIHQTRLATGKRINSAADDPAGLAISTKMLARSEGLKTALSNIGDAKNLLAVAESGLGRLNDILSSMRTITEQAANDTNGTEERDIVKEQLASYAQQINDIVDQTKWSDKQLINGDYNSQAAALTFQTGVDSGETTTLYGLQDMHALKLELLKTAVVAANGTFSDAAIGTGLTAAFSSTFTTELAAGTYRVVTTFGTDGSYTANLMSGATGGTSVAVATGSYSAGVESTLHFMNGVDVVMASAGIYTAGDSAIFATSGFGTAVTAVGTATVVGTGTAAVTGIYDVSITVASATPTIYTATFGTGTEMITATGLVADLATNADVDFGNGIKITLDPDQFDASADDVTVTGSIDYTAATAGTYAADSSAFHYTQSVAAEAAGVNVGKTTVGNTTTSVSADFSAYMDIIDNAMKTVNAQLSKIGSLTGSLTFKEDQISSSQINVEASYNRIMNANMAEEQVNASKLLILQQTSTAMLAQANAAPQFLLSLFK